MWSAVVTSSSSSPSAARARCTMLKHSTIRKGSIHIGPRSFTISEYVLSPEPPASKQVNRLIQRGILVHVREEKVDAAPAVVPVPEPSGAGDGLVASDLPVAGNESPSVTALEFRWPA